MFLSNPAKSFCFIAYVSLVLIGCNTPQSADNRPISSISEAGNEFPFSTMEPTVYQADIIVAASGIERKMFVARNGQLRRSDFNVGESSQFSILQTDKDYLISANGKMFAEDSGGELGTVLQAPFDELTGILLYGRARPEFTSLGRENDLSEYGVRLNGDGPAAAVIFINETVGLPVRQEFYSIRAGERTLQYSVEVRNLKLETEAGLFEIPAGFRQTSISAVRSSLHKTDK